MDTNGNSVIDDIYYAFLKKRNELNRLVKKNQEEIYEGIKKSYVLFPI